MSIPVNQLTVEQAHKEFNSLADKTAAKYEQLDSSEFGAVDTPVFNAKSAKLASLFACMSQLCQRLIGDWLCILPAITLVVDKSQKVNKVAFSDW